MLSNRQLEALLDVFQGRMQAINDDYLRRMGEHIADIGTLWPSDVNRLVEMRRMRMNTRAIRRRIAEVTGQSVRDIDRIFRAVAESHQPFARAWYGSDQAPRVIDSPQVRRLIKAQLRQTAQRMQNLSNTTVASGAYRRAVDAGISAVSAGVEDYGAAVRRALREAGREGLRVEYESGQTRRLDSAVRQNILDGVRQLNQDVATQVGREFGADGVEIDAHMLCAEDHLPYQGRQFTNAEFEEIQAGLPRPFGEWNCRHTWAPIIVGVSPPAWTPEQLERFEKYSTEPVEIDGRTKTRYQWSQEMRRMETAVRYEKDTANLAAAAGDDALRRQCQAGVLDLQERYRRVAEGAGLDPDWKRMNVMGFRDAKSIPVQNTGDVGVSNGQIVDWASANSFAGGDTRLTNMLRSGDAQQTASAVNEILNGESYGFRESKWSGHVNVGNSETMERALGRKEWSCDISIREDNVGNIKTYIHEDLHSRSASYFSPDTYAKHKASEEAAVEYMAQQICERAKIPYNPSYNEHVNALNDIRLILEPKTSAYDFAKAVFDKDENLRYTYIANRVNGYKINNPEIRGTVRDRLNEDLRILAGIRKGGRSYDGR